MLKRFIQKMEDMRRLIDDSRSASVSVGGSGNHWGRKRATPLAAGGGTHEVGGVLSAPVVSAPRYLLAVSGGMDSMCMADLFLRTLGAGSFSIAHCNFSLRGEESDGDEALVRGWAQDNGVELFVKRFDTAVYAREKGISIEMAARDLRYGWFAQLCQEHGFAALSVAHNANDNAETLFLNLLRGTGLKGLHGMSEVSVPGKVQEILETPVFATLRHPLAGGGMSSPSSCTLPMMICRPLMEFTRKQIEGYVLTHRVPYRHDSSNFSSDYKRNRIRNEVFPIFEKVNPSFIRTLNREIGYFSEAEEIVSDWCNAYLPQVLDTPSDEPGVLTSVSIAKLMAVPQWRYLLYHILEPYGFNSSVLESLHDLLTSERTASGKRFEADGYLLLVERDALVICRKEQDAIFRPSVSTGDGFIQIPAAGIYVLNGRRFSVELIRWEPDMPLKQPQGTLIMDAGRLRFPFACRRWLTGDWMVPMGMRGKKKLSDLFTDLKYTRIEKAAALAIVDCTPENSERQRVAGVLGVRIDDRFKVTENTRSVIRITLL